MTAFRKQRIMYKKSAMLVVRRILKAGSFRLGWANTSMLINVGNETAIGTINDAML
jgi:hypothetical protein